MKKIFKLLFLSLLVMFLTGISCTKEKPLCEKNNFGHVIIHNNTSINPLWVDATSYGSNENKETPLSPGASATFTVKPGEVRVWAASPAGRANNSWNVDYISIFQCDEFSYTWTNKKGGDGNSFVDIKDGGKSKLSK
jgi:hypothetical protein